MLFNVDYFDGKSSKTYKATLTPSPASWKISYVDNFKSAKSISWNHKEITKSNVYTKGWVSFTYGKTFPFQKIESNDPAFISYINNDVQNVLSNKIDILLHRSVNKSLTLLVFILIGIGLGTYFYIIPTVAKSFVTTLNKKSVVQFGESVFNVLATNLTIDDDRSKKLQEVIDVIHFDNTFPLKVYVAESDEINAFALSGGKIVVFSSLLEKIETEAQLAALISHEVSHIENRHVLKNITRNLAGAIFVSVLFGDINSVTTILTDNAHLFSQLSYTRELEKEADIFGLSVLKKNNIDQNGMPQLFQILKTETNFDMPTYLSNHPMLNDRILYTQEIAKTQKNSTENLILKEKWTILKATFKKNNITKNSINE